MKVHFKITTWEELTVNEEDEKELLEDIKNGKITASYQVYQNYGSAKHEIILEVEEQMTVEENDGCSTIEVYDDYNNLLFCNQLYGNEVIK
tara:strand:- start:546 stop:818 length:273 start_codon:yes stop_codon:yes gene_type:complete